LENSDELNSEDDKNDDEKINKNSYEHLNIHSSNSCMKTVSILFQKAIKISWNDIDDNEKELQVLTKNLIKWEIRAYNSKIVLQVFKKITASNEQDSEWDLKPICEKTENYYYPYKDFGSEKFNFHEIIASSLFSNNDIVILTTFGILIYYFSENNKIISLNYFYHMNVRDKHRGLNKDRLQYYKEVFSKPTLPLPNYESFRLKGWLSDAKDNKLSLLKYGVELLTFAIKEHKLELIDYIYKRCMTYFKEDLMNNKAFLGIITSTMPLLNEYYPEYILKYSSETFMIMDSYIYSIVHRNKNLHLYSFFQPPQIANLSQSLLWTKYYQKLYSTIYERKSMMIIISVIQVLIILLTLPLYFATFYILSKYHFINDIYITDAFSFVYFYADHFIFKKDKNNIVTVPTITFMIPYVNFVNYSKDYNWFLELIRPQSSPFTETINRNIYKTWNGEALINFKWNTYGKYYYAMIWTLFMALLGCFTAAATIPQQYINEDVRQQLFIASIILGSIHLFFEFRQFFYNITKWFYNFWNIFGKCSKCLIILQYFKKMFNNYITF
jgi:hypothetical protein